MFHNILNGHMFSSSIWWVEPGLWNRIVHSVSELEQTALPGLQDAPGCLTSPCVELFGLSPGNRQERHVGTGAAVNLSPLFLFLGRRRGPWPTNTGLALRIWSSASPAPRHSRPWSAALTATPTRPRLVALVVIGSAPRLLVLTSVWATAGPVSLRGFGPCP